MNLYKETLWTTHKKHSVNVNCYYFYVLLKSFFVSSLQWGSLFHCPQIGCGIPRSPCKSTGLGPGPLPLNPVPVVLPCCSVAPLTPDLHSAHPPWLLSVIPNCSKVEPWKSSFSKKPSFQSELNAPWVLAAVVLLRVNLSLGYGGDGKSIEHWVMDFSRVCPQSSSAT